ncbi:MAG: hypothetical protein HZB91_00385 [Elusimicrobia bacterium]|nr:hypothetical protein [Elusimicrobiota bacterium]
MKKGIKTGTLVAMGLVLAGIGWSLAAERKQAEPKQKGEAIEEQKQEQKERSRRIKPSQGFLAGFFAASFERKHLAGGYRSLTLPIKEYQLLNIRPGDFVDVLATFDAAMADKRKEKVTATLLQHVLVLGVVKCGDLEGKGAVHLMVNPNEGQYAALARYQGEIDLALRAEGDSEMHPMEMASFRKLFSN